MAEFDRLLLFRALRPDRLIAAMKHFVTNTLGKDYSMSLPYNLEAKLQVLCRKLQQTMISGKFLSYHNVLFSMAWLQTRCVHA